MWVWELGLKRDTYQPSVAATSFTQNFKIRQRYFTESTYVDHERYRYLEL